jgi:oligopeptide transport system substrate-binding protein
VSTANILRDLYEGLTSEDAEGRVVPGAADRWTVSADGRIYQFHLREAVRWSNGDPVTADDFVAGLRRSVVPQTGSAYSGLLSPIENAVEITAGHLPGERLGVAALDVHTLEIRLQSPTTYFLRLLAHEATFPIHRPSLLHYGDRFARPGRLVSNGAYRLSDWVIQAQVVLERNPFYWANAQTAIDRVVYIPTEDPASELKRYRAGELDITYQVPLVQLPWLKANLPTELHLAPYLGVYYYGLNLTRAPFLNHPGLRQALALALDTNLIADKVMHGAAGPATGWIPQGTDEHLSITLPWANWPPERRMAEAKRLYREAGYSEQHPLELEIRYNTQTDNRRIATVAAAMWKQNLGANVTLVNQEWKVFLQERRARRLTQVFVGSWIADYDDPLSFLEILESNSGLNASGYTNLAFDASLTQARSETDPQQRREQLHSAEQLVLNDLPVLPIYFYQSKHLVKPQVQGWRDNPVDHHYSKDLRLVPSGQR